MGPPRGRPARPSSTAANPLQQPKEVLELVCAAAKMGQREAMLVAILHCKPAKAAVGSLLMSVHSLFCSVEKGILTL